MSSIFSAFAGEIRDSQGDRTVQVNMWLEHGVKVSSSVPSGPPTDESAAVELWG
jgi:enolase